MFFIFQNFWQKYGKGILFPGILVIGGLLYFLFSRESTTPQVELIETFQMSEQNEQLNNEEMAERITQSASVVMVDVKGAVKHPGMYQLTDEERVMDAVILAGGYLENADTRLINHAQRLQDEMIIYIPKIGEVVEALAEGTGTTVVASTNDAASDGKDGKVNINKADEALLTSLPGIGPAKAQAILAYRQEIGQFKKIEDLKEVSGIGEKTFEQLKDLVSVK